MWRATPSPVHCEGIAPDSHPSLNLISKTLQHSGIAMNGSSREQLNYLPSSCTAQPPKCPFPQPQHPALQPEHRLTSSQRSLHWKAKTILRCGHQNSYSSAGGGHRELSLAINSILPCFLLLPQSHLSPLPKSLLPHFSWISSPRAAWLGGPQALTSAVLTISLCCPACCLAWLPLQPPDEGWAVT